MALQSILMSLSQISGCIQSKQRFLPKWRIFCWFRNIPKASYPRCTREAPWCGCGLGIPSQAPLPLAFMCQWVLQPPSHCAISTCHHSPESPGAVQHGRNHRWLTPMATSNESKPQPEHMPDDQGRWRQPGMTGACCRPCCPFPGSLAGVSKGPPERWSPCVVPAAQSHGLIGITEGCLTWCLFPKETSFAQQEIVPLGPFLVLGIASILCWCHQQLRAHLKAAPEWSELRQGELEICALLNWCVYLSVSGTHNNLRSDSLQILYGEMSIILAYIKHLPRHLGHIIISQQCQIMNVNHTC